MKTPQERFDEALQPRPTYGVTVVTITHISFNEPIPHSLVTREVNRRIAMALPGRHDTFVPKSGQGIPLSSGEVVSSARGFADV